MPNVYVEGEGGRRAIEVSPERYRELTGMEVGGGVMDLYTQMVLGAVGSMPSAPGAGPGYEESISPYVGRALGAVGERLGEMIFGPASRVGEAIMTGKDISLEDITAANMMGQRGGLSVSGKSVLYKQYLDKMKSEGRIPTLTEKDFAQFEKPVSRFKTGLETMKDSELSNLGPIKDPYALNKVLEEVINRLPDGNYLLNTTGRVSPSLREAVSNKLGYDVDAKTLEKTIRGLAVNNPKAIEANLTLGLEEVRLLGGGKSGVSLSVEAPDLLSTIRSLQHPGQPRELVSISQLRDKAGMPPEEFDAQLLKLAQEGKVALHQHDFAMSLKPEDRAKLLAVKNPYNTYTKGVDYFVGVVPK